ncbi:MAG: T9SS type A sorting domain-containing protein [Phaeodactylibacter sp.]|nr:T9SS type A sorting domain-containing protein [Phaeodactylibacter sp.]
MEEEGAQYLQIIDVSGKICFIEPVKAPRKGQFDVDLSEFSPGVYLCQLITDQGVLTKKIVKE